MALLSEEKLYIYTLNPSDLEVDSYILLGKSTAHHPFDAFSVCKEYNKGVCKIRARLFLRGATGTNAWMHKRPAEGRCRQERLWSCSLWPVDAGITDSTRNLQVVRDVSSDNLANVDHLGLPLRGAGLTGQNNVLAGGRVEVPRAKSGGSGAHTSLVQT